MTHAYRRHRLVTKDRKVKKQHRESLYAADANSATVRKMLPYA